MGRRLTLRRSTFPRAKYKPPKEPIKIRELLDRTLLLPMNASLAALQQTLIPRKGTTPLQESWKVIRGQKKAPTGKAIAEKLGLPAPAVTGFATEMLIDLPFWKVFGIVIKGLVKGTAKGVPILTKAMSKTSVGRDALKGTKALKQGFKNTFDIFGHVPTRKQMDLFTREGALELKPLLENRHFMIKSLDSRILNTMTKLAAKHRNFSAVDLEMVPTIIESKFNLTKVIKLHGRAPSKELVELARATSKYLGIWHAKAMKVGLKEKDLKAIGYFPHMLTAEAREILETLYPKVLKHGGVAKLYMPKHRWMTRRSTGYLDIPVGWMKLHHPRAKTIKKFLHAELPVYRIPLSHKRTVSKVVREMRRLGEKPTFGYWTIREINVLAKAGRLPILKGKSVDKFMVDNPYMASTYRLFGSARAISNKEFLDNVARPETAGGFAKYVGEVAGDPEWIKSPLIANNIAGGDVLRFPKEVVQAIDRGYKATSLTDETRAIMGMFDHAQSVWKQITLLPVPGYHVRNAFGNAWNNYLAGLNNPIRYFQSMRIQDGAKGKIGAYTYKQLREMIIRFSIRGRGFYAKEARQEKFLAMLTERMAPKAAQKINPLYYGRMFGEYVEDNARVALFIDQLAKGKTAEIAAKTVRKFLFNYDELSQIERKLFRRVIPFYTWSRFNIPLQIEQMITNPGRWLAWAKGARAIEPTIKPDERYMPDWLKEAAPVLIKRDPKSGQYQYFILRNWLPAADLQDLFKGDTLIEMLSPFIKAPLEWFTNYSSFAERSIERYPSEVQNYLGVQMPRRIANLIRNIRLLNMLDRFNPGFAFGTKDKLGIFGFTRSQELELPMKVRLVNLLSGLKLQNYHFEQAKKHHDRVQAESIMALRNYQRSAFRRGYVKEGIRLQKLIEKEMLK